VIDLHCHLLPGVDDGAATLEQAVEMCRLAAADGCTHLVATPHRRRDEWPDLSRHELEALLEQVRGACGPAPRLLLGGEVRVDSELANELAAGVDSVLPLGGSSSVLLELEPRGLGPDPHDLVRELAGRGLRAVIAHPELTPALREDPELLADLVAAGALLQVTAASIAGDFGRAPRAVATELLDAGMVHVVASDSHRPDWRPPGLSRARDVIARQWGDETAQAVTRDHPLAILEDRVVAGSGPGVPT